MTAVALHFSESCLRCNGNCQVFLCATSTESQVTSLTSPGKVCQFSGRYAAPLDHNAVTSLINSTQPAFHFSGGCLGLCSGPVIVFCMNATALHCSPTPRLPQILAGTPTWPHQHAHVPSGSSASMLGCPAEAPPLLAFAGSSEQNCRHRSVSCERKKHHTSRTVNKGTYATVN